MSDCSCKLGGGAPGAGAAKISVCAVVASSLRDVGTLWRVFLAFALWFAVAAVPWVNLGATMGLLAVMGDIARGRPVSPIDVLLPRGRAKILPGLATTGLVAAAVAGVAAAACVVAFHTGLFFAVFPGWSVSGAAMPCPCLARTSFQRFAALVTVAGGAVPVLATASALAFALPALADTGETGLEAMRRSVRLVSGNLAPVMALVLVPALLALAIPLALPRLGSSVFSVFVLEAVVAVVAVSLLGHAYGALLAAEEARASDCR